MTTVEKKATLPINASQLDHIALSVANEDIANNDYNLSVSSYIEAKDTHEVIDITELNTVLKTTVSKIEKLLSNIDAIVSEIESAEAQA